MPAAAGLVEVLVLDVVEAVLVGLPDVEQRAGDRLAVGRAHRAAHEARHAGRAVGEVVAVLEGGRALDEEGAEDRRLGGAGRAAVVHATTSIDSPRVSEARTNSWRLSSVMWPVRVRKSMAANHSSSVERDLGGEGVQVAHERLQDLAQARDRACRRSWPRRPGSGRRRRGCAARCLRGWLARSPFDLRAGRPACQVPLHGLGARPDPASRRARSRARAPAPAARRSWPRRPMSWTPTGRPAVVRATGTATAGSPSALAYVHSVSLPPGAWARRPPGRSSRAAAARRRAPPGTARRRGARATRRPRRSRRSSRANASR